MQQSTRIGNVRLKFLPSDRTSYVPSLALKAACITAGLVTAFAIGTDNSASAQVITSQGNEIFDLSLDRNCAEPADHITKLQEAGRSAMRLRAPKESRFSQSIPQI